MGVREKWLVVSIVMRKTGSRDTNTSAASSSVDEKGSMVGARQRSLYVKKSGLALARPADVRDQGCCS